MKSAPRGVGRAIAHPALPRELISALRARICRPLRVTG